MNKREIIERLKNIARHAVHNVGEKLFVMSLDDGIAVYEAIELLENPETNCSEIPNNWIPCSERLPKEYGEYLVTYKSDGDQMFMDIVEYEPSFEFDHEKNRFKGNWLFADDCRSVNPEVIAWMPLPKAYQEGGE